MSRSTLVTWAVFTALLSMALFVAACSSDLSGPALVGAEPVQAASQEAAEPAAADPAPQEEVAAEAAPKKNFRTNTLPICWNWTPASLITPPPSTIPGSP
ncbi:MAG: hypothetical protein KatS3mg050_4975 [Litorilinea sp.]|nr:MAG: hypothetical protein KatS3mg050_4975 [Litorilinea sp.]